MNIYHPLYPRFKKKHLKITKWSPTHYLMEWTPRDSRALETLPPEGHRRSISGVWSGSWWRDVCGVRAFPSHVRGQDGLMLSHRAFCPLRGSLT